MIKLRENIAYHPAARERAADSASGVLSHGRELDDIVVAIGI